jgi:hypothetical protein
MNRHITFWGILLTLIVIPLQTTFAQSEADLQSIKIYLLEKGEILRDGAADLAETSTAYYELAEAANFDYAQLWEESPSEVAQLLQEAKDQWIFISPIYEQIEGIVAGVPSLSEFDINIDAGMSAEEDPASAVTFDLPLPDGTVLPQPGNLFNLLEAALWGTRPEFIVDVEADLDENGSIEFGEVLPDANMLKGSADLMATMTADLQESAEAWEPTIADAFTALVVMVPTMSEYFESWKESRFVAGDEATNANFAVISRLADIQDILSSLQVLYVGVSPLVTSVSEVQHGQIDTGLTDLKDYVSDLYEQEREGRRFTAEEADFFGTEAQNRAMIITGQITQAAALLEIPLPE